MRLAARVARLPFAGFQLVHQVRANLLCQSYHEALALDRVAMGILVERKRGLLLDLLDLGYEFFQLEAAVRGNFPDGAHITP